MSTTASTATTTAARVLPGRAAPELDLPIAGGGRFRLSDSRPGLFTMVVFNRGLHCPICRAQLSELNRRIEELAERGIEIVSVSGETAGRAERILHVRGRVTLHDDLEELLRFASAIGARHMGGRS